jgi:hypothetical protein
MGALSSFIYTGGRRIDLKVRRCLVFGGRLHYVHLPKLHVVDVLRFSRFSNQGLALETLIPFPIRLQSVLSWT